MDGRNPINVAVCFMLALAMTLGWSFLEIWTDEPGLTLAAMAAGTIAIIAVWAGIWAVTSRLIRKRSYFKNHVALICLYMIAGTCAWYAEIYVDFLTNENWLSSVVVYGCNFVLLACLLYYSLNIATRMPRRQQKTSAVVVSAALIGGVYLFSLVSAKTFNQQPLYPTTLEPYLAQFAPADTVDGFIKDSKKLFSSDVFEKKKAAKKDS
jgi:Na+-translocating ferredoxin:NAD+ oxidoreductase RnfA subunit